MNLKPINEIKGVIFDLDNTLVSSSLDFKTLKQSIGCCSGEDILEFVNKIESKEHRQQADAKILAHEYDDAMSSEILTGAHDLIAHLNLCNIPTAIVTRNSKQSSEHKIKKHSINIENVITREMFPPKPDPTALNHIANQWQLQNKEVLYVGDYLYDIQAAQNAKMQSCLISHFEEKPYQDQADIVVDTLSELKQLLIKINSDVV